MTAVTRHAEQRVRGRLGLPKRAAKAAARRALRRGIPRERYAGPFRDFLDRVSLPGSCDLRVLAGIVYIFDRETPVTVYPVPVEFRAAADRPSESPAAVTASDGDAPEAPATAPDVVCGPACRKVTSHSTPPTDPPSARPAGAATGVGDHHHHEENPMSDPHSGARAAGNGSAWGGLSSSTPAGSAAHGPGGTPAPGGGKSSTGSADHGAAKSAGNGSAWSGLGSGRAGAK